MWPYISYVPAYPVYPVVYAWPVGTPIGGAILDCRKRKYPLHGRPPTLGNGTEHNDLIDFTHKDQFGGIGRTLLVCHPVEQSFLTNLSDERLGKLLAELQELQESRKNDVFFHGDDDEDVDARETTIGIIEADLKRREEAKDG